MDEKVEFLLKRARKLLIELTATVEDLLEIPYDQSYLHSRREKVKRYG